MLTLAMAIEKSGLTRAELMKAIKARRLPAEKGRSGAWQIAEHDLASFTATPRERRRPDAARAAEQAMLVTLEAEIRALRHQNQMLRQQLSEVSADRDIWARKAEENSALARDHALRPTDRKLAELRRDALLRAKIAAEAEAREAELHAGPHETESAHLSPADWSRRFGQRSA